MLQYVLTLIVYVWCGVTACQRVIQDQPPAAQQFGAGDV